MTDARMSRNLLRCIALALLPGTALAQEVILTTPGSVVLGQPIPVSIVCVDCPEFHAASIYLQVQGGVHAGTVPEGGVWANPMVKSGPTSGGLIAVGYSTEGVPAQQGPSFPASGALVTVLIEPLNPGSVSVRIATTRPSKLYSFDSTPPEPLAVQPTFDPNNVSAGVLDPGPLVTALFWEPVENPTSYSRILACHGGDAGAVDIQSQCEIAPAEATFIVIDTVEIPAGEAYFWTACADPGGGAPCDSLDIHF
jgi:hypothetical protein